MCGGSECKTYLPSFKKKQTKKENLSVKAETWERDYREVDGREDRREINKDGFEDKHHVLYSYMKIVKEQN